MLAKEAEELRKKLETERQKLNDVSSIFLILSARDIDG